MPRVLPEGLYERVVTHELELALQRTRAAGLQAAESGIDRFEADALLARHVADELTRALGAVGGEDALSRRVELCNAVIALLHPSDVVPGARVDDGGRVLRSVHRSAAEPPRTETPLAVSTLLTGADAEPRLGHELEREMASADGVDALVSFVTWEGWRRLQHALEALATRGRRLRLITTTYTGATDAEAVEAIAGLPGAEVRVSYDTRRTRLHAKAWLFH